MHKLIIYKYKHGQVVEEFFDIFEQSTSSDPSWQSSSKSQRQCIVMHRPFLQRNWPSEQLEYSGKIQFNSYNLLGYTINNWFLFVNRFFY